MISVLCVDDETPLCELAKRILEETKEFSVDTAGSAEEALEKVHTMSYDAIVSDYQMNGMDGIAFLKALRSSGITTPFIICIDNAQKDVIISAFENGADFHIGKDGELNLHFAELSHKIRAGVRHRNLSDSLIRSEEKYRAYTEHSPVGIFVVDRTGRYIDVNPAACSMLGYSRSDLLDMHITDITPADRVALEFERFNSLLLPTGKMSVESLLIKKDGSVITVILDATRLPDNTFMAFCTDITDNKLAEAKLEHSNRMLGIALTAANAGTWDRDFTTGILTWSPEFFELFGLPPDAPPSFETWLNVLHPDDRGSAMTKIDASVRDHTPLWNEYRVILPDGTVRWIGAGGNTTYSDTGEPLRISGVCIDISTRKQAELALVESELQYRLVVENACEGIVVAQDGLVKFANPGVLKMAGSTLERTINQLFVNFIHPDDRAVVTDCYQRRIRGENVPTFYDFRVLGEDGRITWVQISAVVISWKGRPATLNFLSDITDRKEVEIELRSAQERLGEAHRLAHIGTWDWKTGSVTMTWSEELYQIAGLDPALPAPGCANYSKIYTPASWERLSAAIKCAIETGKPFNLELDLVRPDGSIRVVTMFCGVQPDVTGQVTGLHGMVQDITDRKAAEEALRKSERIYKNLIENISDVLFKVSPENIITYISPVVSRFGIRDKDVEGKFISVFIHPDDYEVVEKAVAEVLSGGEVTLEFRIRNPPGDIFHIRISARPEWNEGKVTGIAGIMTDITSIKDLESLKVKALKKIDENLVEMAILNDQIRNPLAVIMAAADLTGGSAADDIIRQVQEIDAMINKIDRKWVESEKVREFLKKYYGVGVQG